jgi:hypothetical protein
MNAIRPVTFVMGSVSLDMGSVSLDKDLLHGYSDLGPGTEKSVEIIKLTRIIFCYYESNYFS